MKQQAIAYSLIVATVDRTGELSRFLQSLENIRRDDFELVIVDQNSDQRLKPILLETNWHFSIRHIRCSERNACLARNLGASVSQGHWLGFPDDDCLYPENFFDSLSKLVEALNPQMMIGDVLDFDGKPLNIYWGSRMYLSFLTAYGRCAETCLFIKRDSFEAIGGFDPAFGPGSLHYAAEGMDLLVRCLSEDPMNKAVFDPHLYCIHPRKSSFCDDSHMHISWMYRYGYGAVHAKHWSPVAAANMAFYFMKFAAKMLVFRGKRRQLAVVCLKGYCQGFRDYKKVRSQGECH